MLDMQTKNIIKTVAIVLLALFLGEGVFGLGIYWPIFFLLIDWAGVYWFSVAFGIFISLLTELKVGLPSLFVLLTTAVISNFVGVKKSSRNLLVVLGVVGNLLFDKMFGLSWSFWEMILVFGVGMVAVRGLDKQDVIRINY